MSDAHTDQVAHVKKSSFICQERRHVPALDATIAIYQHQETKAQHIHIESENNENVMMVALRTIPSDDSGVAHILEHTVLCGSKHYPVRDPFFMMIRRSLNTFMNAFTSSDWTAYPFASCHDKDFDNLTKVYLDAVFFSRLDHLDFSQEGHRLAFSESDNPSSELTYAGVVYNEMKGAMSSPVSVLWQALSKHLFPSTTYHYNSGGEPEAIPNLSYDALQAFYQKHYHPSNAIFLTYGNMPADKHQASFQALVLDQFSCGDTEIAVPLEKGFNQPLKISEVYASDKIEQHTYHCVAWLLGDVTDFKELVKIQLMSRLLLDHSGSPLLHALETCDFATGPSPILGVADDQRNMAFVCGVEGSDADDVDAFESLLQKTLENVVNEGIAQDQVEAALRQFELAHREISGGSMPYGLQLLLQALPAAVHRADIMASLDIDEVLKEMREAIKDRGFIPGLIRQYLLDNQKRLTLSLVPDNALAAQKIKAEQTKLANIKSTMTDEALAEVVTLNQALLKRQSMDEDLSILPKVTPQEIPKSWSMPASEVIKLKDTKVATYAQPCNGILYYDAVVPLPASMITPETPWLLECMSGLGVGQDDYRTMEANIYQKSGGIGASLSITPDIDDPNKMAAYVVVGGKSLTDQVADMLALTHLRLHHTRFDEQARLQDLLLQYIAEKRRSITHSGHSLAMCAASAVSSKAAACHHQLYGLGGIAHLLGLEQHLGNRMKDLPQLFSDWYQGLVDRPLRHLWIGEAETKQASMSALGSLIDSKGAHPSLVYGDNSFSVTENKQFWLVDSQVNFCAKSYATVGIKQPACPTTAVVASSGRKY